MSDVQTEPAALDYADYVERLHAQDQALAAELAGFHGVERVLQWMQERGLIHTAIDLVGQDEFSYDFLVQLGLDGRWLAFGVT